MSQSMSHQEPVLIPAKTGWFAHGIGWAVHAQTREEAVRKYLEREALYAVIDRRPYWNELKMNRESEGLN